MLEATYRYKWLLPGLVAGLSLLAILAVQASPGNGEQGISLDYANVNVTNLGEVSQNPAFTVRGPESAPQTVNFQGHLTDPLGNPIVGDVDVTFRLYDHATDGPALWGETQTATAEDGLVSLELGTVDPLTPELFAGGERWLGIQVGGDPEMLPRHPVSSVPYSLVAATAGALDCTGCVDSSELANGSVTTAKLRGGAVTGVKLAAGSVTTNKIATNAVTNAQLAANSVESTKIVDRSVTAADLANNAVNSSKIANDSVQAQDVAFNYAGSSTKGGKATDSDLVDGLDSTALALVEHDHCWVELGIFTLVESFGIGSSCVSVKTVDAPGGDPGPLGEGPAHNFVGDASMALGTDGLPIISYTSGRQDGLDFVDEEIRVAHCNDLECSSATITVIDSAGEVGTFSSIAIGADGFPIISYYDDTNENLKVAHCNNVACTSALAFTAVDDPGNVGRLSSMGIGGDGFPVISYYDETNKTIRLLHCLNVPCTGGSSRRIDSSEPFFGFGSLAVGSDGLPIIMYQSVPPGEFDPVPIKVAHCNDATCTDPTINVVGGHGFLGSMVIGADGLPLLSVHGIVASKGRPLRGRLGVNQQAIHVGYRRVFTARSGTVCQRPPLSAAC